MADDMTGRRRSRRGTGGVTLHEVAKLAGIAPITASRALNTPDKVSAEVLHKVRDAVARTGYVPNRLAGGLASARSRLVAAVVPTIAGWVFLKTITALTESLASSGYELMLGQSGYTDSREDSLIETIITRRPEGIVLTGVMHSAAARRRLHASGIPVVETWDLSPTPVDMLVGFSHDQVGREVADHLYDRGFRRFAIVAGDDERSQRRQAAFVARAEMLSVPTAVVTVAAPTTLKQGREALASLALGEGRLGVFCSSDLLGLGLLTEAQVRGVEVPSRLGIIGFGDLDFSADVAPALSTVRIDGTAIGRQAARFILERAAGRPVSERVLDIGFSIVVRSTT
jgi:LacI family gluconate utilization system Gnt-I transcriptional repressor